MPRSPEFVRGAKSAADVASMYDSCSTHRYRLDDCILGKSFLHGAAVALAEMNRRLLGGKGVDGVRAAAKNLGLTIARCKAIGVMPFDWQELERAGVEAGKARKKKGGRS